MADTPLLTFSGAGLLGFYFQGVCAYIQDNFDLTNVRFAGISAGSCSAAALGAQLPVEASMCFGLKWIKLLTQRKFRSYFIPPKLFIELGSKICDDFGISEEYLLQNYSQGRLYVGVTNMSSFPPTHDAIPASSFKSRKENFYVMSCSMRILPFFTSIGYYNKKWLIDGGFSSMFCIPDDANPNKIIRITPISSIKNADIKPDHYNRNESYSLFDIFRFPSLNDILEQFRRGYNDGIRGHDNLIKKGLQLKKKIDYLLKII